MVKNKIIFLQAVSTLVGTIIGAGVLGIPYVFVRAGFWTGAAVLTFITFAMVSIKLMFGEVVLRTSGKHQVSGYVEKYLGKFWKGVVSIVIILTISGMLLAYFIGIGEVLAEVFGGNHLWWGTAFYIIASICLFYGINIVKRAELILTIFIFIIIFIIFYFSLDHLEFTNLSSFYWAKLLVPYGVILFACSGIVAIPQARRILYKRENLLKKAIIVGSIILAIVYLLFAWIVVSVSGFNTTEIATIGLGHVMGERIIIIGNIFAFLTMSTSFLTMGLALKGVYNYDFKIKHVVAWLLAIIVPLIIYFLGLHDFIQIIGIVGALGFGVNGVIYIFTYWVARKKGKRKPEYKLTTAFALPASFLLTVVFVGGLIYTLFNMF